MIHAYAAYETRISTTPAPRGRVHFGGVVLCR